MRAVRPALVLALALACGLALAAPAWAGQAGVVARVNDADTITVRLEGREALVRLVGVDAPEPRFSRGLDRRAARVGRDAHAEAKAGEMARHAALGLAGRGDAVTLEREPAQPSRDRYGRRLAYVRLADGRDLGAVLIASGWARAYRRFAYGRKAEYVRLEEEARRAGRGLWGGRGGNKGP